MERTRGYAGATEAYTSREAESKRQMRKDKTPAAAEPAMATTAVGGSKRARAPSAGRGLKDATAAANNKENKAPAAKRKAGMGGKDSAIPVPVAVEPEEAPVVPAALPAAEEAPAARESLGSTSSSVASVETSPVAKEEATAIPVAGSGAASPAAAMTATTGSSAAATTTSSSTVSFPLPVMKPADSVRLRGIAHKKYMDETLAKNPKNDPKEIALKKMVYAMFLEEFISKGAFNDKDQLAAAIAERDAKIESMAAVHTSARAATEVSAGLFEQQQKLLTAKSHAVDKLMAEKNALAAELEEMKATRSVAASPAAVEAAVAAAVAEATARHTAAMKQLAADKDAALAAKDVEMASARATAAKEASRGAAAAAASDLETRLAEAAAAAQKTQAAAVAAAVKDANAKAAEAVAALDKTIAALKAELAATTTRLNAALAEKEAALTAVRAQLAAATTRAAGLEEENAALTATATATETTLRRELKDSKAQMAAALAAKDIEMTGAKSEASKAVEAEKKKAAEALAEAAAARMRMEVVDAKRLALLEEVLTLKGAIRVFVRVRPALPAELVSAAAAAGAASTSRTGGGVKKAASSSLSAAAAGVPEDPLFQFPDARDDATVVEVVEKPGAGIGGYGVGEAKRTRFDYHRVFTPTDGQEAVFAEVEPVVQSAVNGHRVCIFAYGQTGSGKTHTMLGGEADERGLIPRSVEFAFAKLAELAAKGWSYSVSAEMLEIYNEEIRDLLAPSSASSSSGGSDKHEIRHEKDGSTVVTGLSTHDVPDVDAMAALLEAAKASRSTGATNSNAVSSRSHSVFTLRIKLTHAATSQKRVGVMHLVDLAGSERISKSGVNTSASGSDKLLKETQNINKSLSALSGVMMALRANNSHIPFRNSKLTYLLQGSLGDPKCKTLMICNLNPLHMHTQESLCTLRFAKTVSEVSTAGGAAAGGAGTKA